MSRTTGPRRLKVNRSRRRADVRWKQWQRLGEGGHPSDFWDSSALSDQHDRRRRPPGWPHERRARLRRRVRARESNRTRKEESVRVSTAFNRMLAIPGATVAGVSFAPE